MTGWISWYIQAANKKITETYGKMGLYHTPQTRTTTKSAVFVSFRPVWRSVTVSVSV